MGPGSGMQGRLQAGKGLFAAHEIEGPAAGAAGAGWGGWGGHRRAFLEGEISSVVICVHVATVLPRSCGRGRFQLRFIISLSVCWGKPVPSEPKM